MVENREDETKRISRKWTDEEKRYLVTYKTDGAERIAAALGRSVISVRVMACRMHVSLVEVDGDLCPRCGAHRVRKGTSAARHGLCPVCWELEKTEAIRERRALQRAKQKYDAAKHRKGER